jgi:hypothetical protein
MNNRFLLSTVVASVVLSGCSVFQSSAPPSASPQSSTKPSPSSVQPPQRRVQSPRVEVPPVDPQRVQPPQPQPRPDSLPRIGSPDINESEQVSALISYAQNVAALPADGQRRELAGANRSIVLEPGIVSYLKLALLLSMPGTVIEDEARALVLLEPLGGSGAASRPLERFAALLHGQVAERMREQKRTAQLREQLNALKAMERSLMRRSQGRPR